MTRAARAASVHARLLHLAKERGEEFNRVLERYAIERFLYRLSVSPHGDRFWLKGALLFDLWFDEPQRPTRDADFLGFDEPDPDRLAAILREVCAIEHDDAINFDPASVGVSEIREGASYRGLRGVVRGRLGNARCRVQVDVGFGDAVTPGPERLDYPTLLPEMTAPALCVYPRATVVAEKLEAMVDLGFANSRMKDFFDLRVIAQEGRVGASELADAIAATFLRRGTAIPTGVPIALSDEFANDRAKRAQWSAFLRKHRIDAPPLDVVVSELRTFLEKPIRIAHG